ncbi:MAG: calcium-binding protein [Myxococcales bacterium]
MPWLRPSCGLALLALVSCGAPPAPGLDSAETAHRELSLATPCLFDSATGSMTIVLASGEYGHVELRKSDTAILVNGDLCTVSGQPTPFATSHNVQSATITGDPSGAETLLLDFQNGAFLLGTTKGPALAVDLKGGGDILQVRMSASANVVRVGAAGWDFSGEGRGDFTVAGVASATVTLGAGNDTFTAAGGGSLGGPSPSTLPLTVYGGPGNDTLTGGDADDTLYGDDGNDKLDGGASLTDSDRYFGGPGSDTVTYASRSTPVTITTGTGPDDGAASEFDDIPDDMESVVGGSGDDTFTGGAGPQTFYGGPGNDVFEMGLLASTGAGADTVYGGTGRDRVNYGQRLEAIVVTMSANAANDGAMGENDNLRDDVEDLVCPAAANCTVTGNSLANTFTLGGGVDVINGGAGDDVFVMGASTGLGAGADVLAGGQGVDLVDFSAFGAALDIRMDDLASATMSKRIAVDVENLVCPTASTCTVLGNKSNNHLWGSSQADVLNSGAGDDLVETNGGADTIDCGPGSDILIGAGSPVGTTCEL